MRKIFVWIALIIGIAQQAEAQEVLCNVTVNAQAINGVDQKIFKGLQQSIMDLVNQRKWTNDEYQIDEKITINFNLTLTRKLADYENGYEGKLSIQSSRPIYGTDYTSPLMNYVDDEVRFKYAQFGIVEFNENRISGNDPLVSNLSAVVAFYVYMALGMDYDSYKLKGGTEMFNKAFNIVSNAPEGYGIAGWSNNNDKQKNRYWLVNNIQNPRFAKFRESIYNYHRKGLDVYTNDKAAATTMIQTHINDLFTINLDNPASALFLLYFSTKNVEFLNFLKQMKRADREKYGLMLSQMDIPNSQNYINAKM
jgi:hypothetical protein